jgi:hypothetical protein
MIEQKPYGIVMGSDRVKVYSGTGPRHFRSFRAYVYLCAQHPGERAPKPVKCCTFVHQKPSTAKACGERTAKRLMKEKKS